uniref:Uncharacterized protein n=1 Tax=Anguilla anguilla TaxID=7936 RepID=A0A0E9XG57_ANGAN
MLPFLFGVVFVRRFVSFFSITARRYFD